MSQNPKHYEPYHPTWSQAKYNEGGPNYEGAPVRYPAVSSCASIIRRKVKDSFRLILGVCKSLGHTPRDRSTHI